jgi:hypothetical protein
LRRFSGLEFLRRSTAEDVRFGKEAPMPHTVRVNALARTLQRVLARPGGTYGVTLLEDFGGDQDLGRALRMLVGGGQLRRFTEPLGDHRGATD